jgi:hypothetical protein
MAGKIRGCWVMDSICVVLLMRGISCLDGRNGKGVLGACYVEMWIVTKPIGDGRRY